MHRMSQPYGKRLPCLLELTSGNFSNYMVSWNVVWRHGLLSRRLREYV